MITYEEMPRAAQLAYDKTNKKRKTALFLNIPCMIILFIMGFNVGAEEGFSFGLGMGMLFCLAYGCAPSGLVHSEFTLKSKTLWAFGIFALIPALLLFACAVCFGGIFAVVDLVKLLMKKPLISKSEHKYFMETPEAQAEMAAMAFQTAQMNTAAQNMSYGASDVKEELKELKEMLDSGLISQEEFDSKKAELLEYI